MLGYKLPRWFILFPIFLAAILIALVTIFTQQKTIRVNDNGKTITLHTNAATVSDALREAGITIYREDILQPPADAALDHNATVTITRATPLAVIDNSSVVLIRTHQKKINTILLEAGKTLAPADSVYLDGVRAPVEGVAVSAALPHSIVIQRSAPVTIVDNGKAQTITTSALTVSQAISEAGIQLYLADGVTPSLDTPLRSGMTITLVRSLPVTIQVDGMTLQTRTRRKLVGEVLTDAGVTLFGLDATIPALADSIPADGSPIRVMRVNEVVSNDQKPVKYSRSTQDQWMQVAPKAHIVGYGTRASIKSADTADGTIQYWRAVRMYATSYSASRAGTPITVPWYGLTRSGKKLTRGMVAIDLNVMPLGTRLYVPGYGYATAEDTGSGVKGKWIDLGYDDWNYESWHSFVTVYFLAPVPSASQIKWILP
ncbi:MAG: DUF348 domain-containing protein [Chloroflexi bacterium]|nr:DUF348 domain-containing protein [Chloroflexota bacterium]